MKNSSGKAVSLLNLFAGITSLVLSYVWAWQQNWLLMTFMILSTLLYFSVFFMKVLDN